MSEQASKIIANSLPAIVTSLVLSCTSAIAGMYVGYRLIEQRVARVEHDVAKLEQHIDTDIASLNVRLDKHNERLARIESNTEYIRGRLEGE